MKPRMLRSTTATADRRVVDEKSQVVLAGALTQQATDVDQLTPMIEAMDAQLVLAGIRRPPKVLLADAGTARTTTSKHSPTATSMHSSPPAG